MTQHHTGLSAPHSVCTFAGTALILYLLLGCVWLSPAFAAKTAKQPSASASSTVSEGMALTRRGIDGNMCVLTFDDGPSQHTASLLDTLKAYGIPATFFVIGSQVERRPELIRRMIAEGHEVGNHSYSHTALRKMSPLEQKEDLHKLDGLLRELGVKPRFVRPPYGFYDHNTINVVQEMDGHIVMWSVDSQDWRNKDDLAGILSNMQTLYTGAPLRGVFLFHDTHRQTVEKMPLILDALKATGCRFVTLSEYIDTPKVPQETRAAETEAQPEQADADPIADDSAASQPQAELKTEAAASQTPPAETGETPAATLKPETTDKTPVAGQNPWKRTESASKVMGWIFGRMLVLPEQGNSLPH